MVSASEIMKDVTKLVPYFSGAPGADLRADVHKFVSGCDLVKSSVDVNSTQNAIRCIKQRLAGEAFELANNRRFESIDALCDLIKTTYLKKRTLPKIREDITNCKQKSGESVLNFGRKIEVLTNEAKALISTTWTAEQAKSAIDEYNNLASKTFILGLHSQPIKNQLLGQQHVKLADLMKTAEQAEDLLGLSSSNINLNLSMTAPALIPQELSTTTCTFCKMAGHTWDTCLLRRNTAYCNHCGSYGHEAGPQCPQKASAEQVLRCSFCKKANHTVEKCFARLNKLFCSVCGVKGHETNRFCKPKIGTEGSLNDQPGPTNLQTQGRPGNPFRQQPQSQPSNPPSNRAQITCFNCGRKGHIAADCRQRQQPQSENSNGPSQGR